MRERIKRVRQEMEERGIDGLLIDKGENRFYLTGFTGTAGRVLFTPEKNYFITDFRYTEQAREQTDGYEIKEFNKDITQNIGEILKDDGVKELGFETEVISYSKYKEYNEHFYCELVPTKKIIERLRLKKEDKEIEEIRKAIDITDLAFSHIMDFIEPGVSEREVALELEFFMKKKGAEKNAFDFIVASGARSSLPHGVASDKRIEEGDFVTLDFGCFYNGYCSDMTRTIVVGEASDKQKEIYNLVLRAHYKVIDEIKPGMSYKEADNLARTIISEAGYGDNFGHGLGHGIGIEVHEGPRLSYTAQDGKLEPGMIVTDEPGIYLSEWGGVRIEDDLLITENGCKPLNNSPKKLIIL
ncbi:MAG: M24 family metallopeptidase [Bacillota bacterium]